MNSIAIEYSSQSVMCLNWIVAPVNGVEPQSMSFLMVGGTGASIVSPNEPSCGMILPDPIR